MMARESVTQTSATPLEETIAALRDLLPEIFSEGKVDPTKLREVLGDAVEDRPERYSFTWAGKRDAIRLLQVPSRATLEPSRQESVNFDTAQHVFVEGENLEVLKLLYKSYFGRVKMIYIDPPYNTGGDFVYPDDFTDPLGRYLELTGQIGDDGNLLSSNTETNGRFHSAWLTMMYPRLFIARQLLREDGVILVSCNDIEQAHLRIVLSELFGEENFVATFIWNNEGNIDNQSKIKVNHEYIHVYARNSERFERPIVVDPNIGENSKLFRDEIENSITKNGPANPASQVTLPIGFPATFESGVIEPRTDTWPHVIQPIRVDNYALVQPAVVESGWSSRNLLLLFIRNGMVPIEDSEGKATRFAVTHTGAIYGYKARMDTQGHVVTVIRNVGTTKQNSNMLERWGLSFDYPKPVMLVEYLCQVMAREDDIVLDFFAGSSTTAHAILEANRVDGAHRRFIMVQLPEPLRNSRFPTISAMSRERIRKAFEDIHAKVRLENGRTAEDGFRAFSLGRSQFKPWQGAIHKESNSYIEQMAAFVDPLIEGWTPETVLWEIALKEGYSLASRVETIDGEMFNAVWRVTDTEKGSTFLACLDEHLDPESLAALDLKGVDMFVCRDSALTDTVAANLALQCQLKTI